MKGNHFRANKIHFTSLGCSRNLVDTEVMLGIVLQAGYEPVADMEGADFYVINTCGFLESARQEAIDTIADLFAMKKKSAKIIVTGCMVQSHREILKEKFPDIHYYLGSGDVANILDALKSEEAKDGVTEARSYLQSGEIPRLLSTPKHYAYLKIAEGCKKRCAFCIIPMIKGGLKSKPVDQVVKEFKALLSQGVKEIILIAQDLGDFGKDRFEDEGLTSLLKELTKIEGDFWIRLLYLYPDEITDELISVMKSDERILPYLDMPIQHINDRVLKSMHRKTNKVQILSIIEKLRKEIPKIVIRTSLMVGFPGETEEDFAELKQFVEEQTLDNIGMFKYSLEKESYSALLPNHIDEETKQRRFEELAKVQQLALSKQLKRFLKQRLEVVVEGTHPESSHLLVGRFYGQCPEIDGMVIINDWKNIQSTGQKIMVEITDILGYDLLGKMISPISNSIKAVTNKLSLV
jgi:ribosomal protein S12 methylthiotransferase